MSAKNRRLLLKNGYIVDGTGEKGKTGNILVDGEIIREISEREITADCETIDCAKKVVAPGFIDMHSHNDWYFPSRIECDFTTPFTRQGITTFIGGNCGFSPAGFGRDTPYMDKILENPFKSSRLSISWSSMDEYFAALFSRGLPGNLAVFAGHGSIRTSLSGFDPASLSNSAMEELLRLLEEAMDQGAGGVSLGLQYEPGIFSSMDEIREVARLVKKKDKLLTVHARASSAVSGTYPLKPFGKPHNILALEDMLDLARETGVRLQFSHLIFVGSRTWGTYDRTMELIDRAVSDGADFKFDTYAYGCGASVISVILPEWFMAKLPAAYESKALLAKLKLQLTVLEKLLGFGYGDIQIAYIDDPELIQYNGRFISEIAGEMKLSPFDTYIKFARSSGGKARVMQYRYSSPEIIEGLMRHPASIFMTDAWVETEGTQNPSCYGCFPKFLQLARERKIISLENAIYKMTGAAAERAAIKDRGVLKAGYAADITIFDWGTVRDNTDQTATDKPPTGIEHVLVNGVPVLVNGRHAEGLRPGKVLKL